MTWRLMAGDGSSSRGVKTVAWTSTATGSTIVLVSVTWTVSSGSGTNNLRGLTENKSVGIWQIRFDFENWLDDTAWSEYEGFRISGENFRLNVDSYNDVCASYKHDGMMFSTKDKQNDNDKDGCAVRYHGAWWYNDCFKCNLNSRYYTRRITIDDSERDFIKWNTWNNKDSLKTCEMKIRLIS